MSNAKENTKGSGDTLAHTLLSISQFPQSLAPSHDDKRIPIPDLMNRMVASYAFQAFETNQLTFNIGDVVNILDRNAKGPEWWKVQRISDNAIGIVPNDYFVSTVQS